MGPAKQPRELRRAAVGRGAGPAALALLVLVGWPPATTADSVPWWTREGSSPNVPVRFSVAGSAGAYDPEGARVPEARAPGAFLDASLRRANEIFAPLGVTFEDVGRTPLSDDHAVLTDRRDRHALGPLVARNVIHVFVVGFLRDVDEPERSRMGVHWTPRGRDDIRPGAHLVILAGYARPGVLAHELGHYLGNPRHSDVPGNVMSYDWGDRAVPVFDQAQRRRIRRFLRRAWAHGTFDPDR